MLNHVVRYKRSLARGLAVLFAALFVSATSAGGDMDGANGAVIEVLGSSVLGKPILGYRWNDGAGDAVLILGAIHGDERESGRLATALLERWQGSSSALHGQHVVLVETVNPDGWDARTRKNANGVDLNRNFPYRWRKSAPGNATHGGRAPLTEPEARIMHELLGRGSFKAIVALHSCRRCGGVNNYDGPARRLAEQMAEHNGYTVTGEWSQPTPGSFGTFAGKLRKIPTLTLEMPRGMPSAGMGTNVAAIEAVVRAASKP